MSEQDLPPQGAPVAQKKVSGLLMVSVLLTLMGIFMVPVLATVAGLITAVKGRKKALADPYLIGPRFGMFCIIAAILALPVNGWQMYRFYDNMKFQQATSEVIDSVFAGLRERNYDAAWDAIDESFQRAVSREDFAAQMKLAFPGEEKLVLSGDTLRNRVAPENMDPEVTAAWKAFYNRETDTLEFTAEIVATEGSASTNIDIEMSARRLGWADYEATVLGVHAWPVEETGESAFETPPENQEPQTDDPEKTSPDKTVEDAPEDNPK